MGDDPIIPQELVDDFSGAISNSKATGGNVVQKSYHYGFTRNQTFLVVCIAMLSLGMSICAVLMMAMSNRASEIEAEATRSALSKTEQENRMLEYYVMELDGKLMASGVIKHSESWSAKKESRK